jgi:hypothetical protein
LRGGFDEIARAVGSGSQFDAGVVLPGPIQEAAVILKRELSDEFMAALSEMLFARDLLTEKDRREVNNLVAERMNLNERSAAFIEKFQAQARVKVAAEHEAAKKAVREQQKKIDGHHEEIVALSRELNRRNDVKAKAVAARDAAKQELRQLSRYSERGEVERLNLLLLERESEAEYAIQEAGSIQMQINQKNLVDLKPLMERLNELAAEEARLAHFVTGQGYTNEVGIIVPARPPL